MSSARATRVVQVVDSLAMGGAQRVVLRLAAAAEFREDVALSIVTIRDAPDPQLTREAAHLGVSIRCIEPRTRRDLADPSMLVRLGKEFRRHDVVQCHLGTANTLGPAAAALARRPCIATLHTVNLARSERRPGTQLRRRTGDLMVRRAATVVVAVGHAVREAQADRTGHRDIAVIPNPAPSGAPISADERARERGRLGLSETGMVLLSVGRLEPPKGLNVLLTSLASIGDATHLVIVGDGSQRHDLEQQAAALGISERVHLIGQTDRVASVLAAADVFVSSSLREGMPMAILEAMARGLPVLATAVGDVASTVAGAGIVVQPERADELADGIRRLTADAGLRASLGSEGLRRAAEYGETRWMQQWSGLWHSLVAAEAKSDSSRQRASSTEP